MAFRSKSVERVLDELTFLAKRYETSYVQFVDNILDFRVFQVAYSRTGQSETRVANIL